MFNIVLFNSCKVQTMRFIVLLFLVLCPLSFSAQDMFDESQRVLDKINDSLVEAVSSFLYYPDNNENTLKVYNRIKDISLLYKDLQENRYEVLDKWDNYKTRKYYQDIDKMQPIADVFEELLRTIAGRNSMGIEGPRMEIVLEPLLNIVGWKKRNLNVFCENAYFCEYEYKGFKMMFIRNTLPMSDYNTLSVSFTYEGRFAEGGTYAVGGNLYRMIQFKDDKNPAYYNVIKAESKLFR